MILRSNRIGTLHERHNDSGAALDATNLFRLVFLVILGAVGAKTATAFPDRQLEET